MTPVRALVALAAVTAALVLQISVFSYVAWDGIVPNLVLLVVVGAALTRGPQFAMVLGFAAGVLVDLAPPADHTAGRWALALMLVGYVAGRFRQDRVPGPLGVLATVAVASFVGTSVFAISGLLLGQTALSVPGLLQVVGIGVAWDLLLTPFVIPVVASVFTRLEPERALA